MTLRPDPSSAERPAWSELCETHISTRLLRPEKLSKLEVFKSGYWVAACSFIHQQRFLRLRIEDVKFRDVKFVEQLIQCIRLGSLPTDSDDG